MIGETQTILAGREDGVPGNCVQAAVASFLDLPIEAVPHFVLFADWWSAMCDWLAERGYEVERVGTREIPPGCCVVVGRSPRGITHVCVAERGQIVWDPHPSREGLEQVTEAWFIRTLPSPSPGPRDV